MLERTLAQRDACKRKVRLIITVLWPPIVRPLTKHSDDRWLEDRWTRAPNVKENMSVVPDTGGERVRTESGSRHTRRGHKAKVVLLALAAGVVVAGLIAGTYVLNLSQAFNEKTETIETAFPEESTRPQKVPTAGLQPMNFLLMGSDSRGATEVDAQNGSASDQRSDVMMLVHVPADRKNVYSISLMRDLWVPIPGHGEAKINAALALGGVPLVVQTVEAVFGQRIDHVAMINFDGFKGLTDALGGVEVNSSVAFSGGGFDYTAGVNSLSGEKALAFVRERHSFPDGDYQRVRNQQAFIKGVIAKTMSSGALANPITINNLVNEFSPFVAVDSTLDAAALGQLAIELKDVRPQSISMFTLPTKGIGTSSDGQSIVLTDPTEIKNIVKALVADKLGDYIAGNGYVNGN